MDLNSSLDDIIGLRTKNTSHRRPQTSNAFHSYRSSSSSSRPISRRIGTTSRYDSHLYDTSSSSNNYRPDLRSRINNGRPTDMYRGGIEKTDLRGRIGKRGNSNAGVGLTTANLPNRQRYQQRRASSYDDNDGDKRDTHGIIITKSVNQQDISPSSSSTSSDSSTGVARTGRVSEVDPSTIVITKNIENTSSTTSQQEQDKKQHQLLQQLQEAERLNQYLQQQQEQQRRQEMDRHLQQQLKSQGELILDLQRQLDQRIAQQSLIHEQQQAMHFGGGGGGRDGNFSFRPMMNDNNNNNNNNDDGLLSYNRSGPNIVLLSNLDSHATANDVKAACGAFGPVTRCELILDTRGRSAGEAEVEFLDRQSALDCIAKFDSEIIDGRLIRAILRQPPSQQMRSVIAPTRSGYRTTSQVLYTSKRS